MATRWMWRPSWIPGPYRWTTPSSRWPGLTTVTSGSLRSASLATPRPRTHSSTPHSLGQCPSVCGIKILFNYILTLKISNVHLNSWCARYKILLSQFWSPMGQQRFTIIRRRMIQKIEHMYTKWCLHTSVTHIHV